MKYLVNNFCFRQSLNFQHFLTERSIFLDEFDKMYQEIYPDGEKNNDRVHLVFEQVIKRNKSFGTWFALRELNKEGFGENMTMDMDIWQKYKENNPEIAQDCLNIAKNQLKAIDYDEISLQQMLDSGCVMKFQYLEGFGKENHREELELYYNKQTKKYFFHFHEYEKFEGAYFELKNIVFSWRNIYHVLKLVDLGLSAELTDDEYWAAIDENNTIQKIILDKIAELQAIEVKRYGRLVAVERKDN
jgi:hypothetical protein